MVNPIALKGTPGLQLLIASYSAFWVSFFVLESS